MRDKPWLIVDTETDGLFEPVHVVEIAAQRMRGWERDGEPFSILLNYDVPIDPAAQAVHGYTREYLREHGEKPHNAHAAFREYAGDLPVVAYNISFDWNRALEPEYRRLGLPCSGRRGFCAMTLSRRVVREAANFKLETLKDHFALNSERSHLGRNDVVTLVNLFERVLAPRLYKAGIVGFEAVAEFSRRTPVAACQEQIHGVGDPVWYLLDLNREPQGPFLTSAVREFVKAGPAYVWREGMQEWAQTSELPEFAPPATRRRTRRTKKEAAPPTPEGCPPGTTMKVGFSPVEPSVPVSSTGRAERSSAFPAFTDAERLKWTDEVVGLCKGIIADGVVNAAELSMLQEWLMACPLVHLFPMSALAEVAENIISDGIVTSDELAELQQMIEVVLETADYARNRKH
ncbi:exonuclease domain-containing protein [Verrucomicrobiota bacterium sgz303538]